MKEFNHGYLLRGECGCPFAAVVDCEDKETLRSLARQLRDGDTYARLPIEDVRAQLVGLKWGGCEHYRAKKAAARKERRVTR